MKGRIGTLDLMRVAALLAVTAYLMQHHLPPVLRGPASYGWLGAGPLLMVSGFVICLNGWDHTPRDFVRGRLARLVPALPLGLPALRLAHGAGVSMLRAEVLFYALFTILLWRGLTRRRAVAFGFGWLIGAVLLLSGEPGLLRDALQPQVAGFFAGGIAFALIRRFGPDVTLAGLAAVAYVLSVHFTVDRMPHRQVLGGISVTVFFALAAAVAHGHGWQRRQWRVAGFVYPFSLLAPSAGWLVAHVPARLHPLVIVPAGLLILAALTHLLAERPLGRLIRPDRPAPAAAAQPEKVLSAAAP